jgi:nucleoid-associated protein YgaU
MRRTVLLLTWLAALAGVLAAATAAGHGALAAPPLRPGAWDAWLVDRGAADAVMALLRLLVVVLAGYLLLATALAMVAEPVLPTPAFVRALVGAALLTGLVLGSPTTVIAASAAEEAPVLRQLDVDPAPAPGAPVPAPRTWTMRPGDHLWRVAEETVGPGAPTAQVARYWERLIERNRPHLADPDNPDLVFAGQIVELPDL